MEERHNNKRIIRNTVMLYVRMLFNVAISLITSRLILNALGVEDYGIYNVVGGIVVLFTFLNSAMASSTQRFLTFELGKDEPENLNKIFSTSVLIHFAISLIIFFLAETVGLWLFYNKLIIPVDRLEAAMWVFQLSVLSCIVSILSVPYNASIIAREKMDTFAYISILDIFLRFLVVVLLYFVEGDRLVLYAFLLFMISLLIRSVLMLYCRRNFDETHFHVAWNKKLFFEMSNFAGWNLFGNMAYVGYTQGVNILLNIFFGPSVNAARAIVVQVQSTLNNFCNSFQSAVNPQITKSYASGDREYMLNLLLASSKYSFFLLLFMALPILIESQQILTLWLKVVPDHTAAFLRIILLVAMVDALANPLITTAQATGKIRDYQVFVGGALLLIVPISYISLKMGGSPESVFIVHLVIVILAQIMRLFMLRSLVDISLSSYFMKVVCPITRVSILSPIIPLIIFHEMDDSLLRLFAIVFTACFSVLFWGYVEGLEKKEKDFIKGKLNLLKERYL